MKRMIKITLILLLVGMAVVAAVPFLKEKEAEKKSEKEFENIQESVTEKKDKTMNVTKLKGENEDCIGYLEVPGTTISYPVMQTRDNPDFYLNHDFNKNYSFYGTPYLSAYCNLKKSDNLIIYGHNINGGKCLEHWNSIRIRIFLIDTERYFLQQTEEENMKCLSL